MIGLEDDDRLVGRQGNDTLNGDAGDDTLKGAGGDDIIDGGAGSDTALYTGNQQDYKITQYQSGTIRIEDVRATPEDGIDVLSNVERLSFADGEVAFNDLTIENAAPDGTVELQANGDIVFTPQSNFFGTTFFDYTVTDGITPPQTARVSLEITNVNDRPFARDDSDVTIFNGPPTLLNKNHLTGNDLEFDGDPLHIIAVNSITGGTATLTAQGDVLFTATGQPGEIAAFSYTVSDPLGLTSTAFVQTTVKERDIYTANDDQFQATENQATVITKAALFENDTNQATGAPILLEVTNATNGTATLNIDGDVVFTPETDFVGTASFTYRVSNGEGGEDTATVFVTVLASQTNTPPIAEDDNSLTTTEDTALTITANTLLTNDGDDDNDPLTITEVSNPLNGSVSLLPNGDIEFTPNENHNGPANFTYTISDGQGGTATAMANITVTPVNDGPVATDDGGLTTLEDTTLIMAASTLLTNDRDVDNDPLVITEVSNPLNGTVTLLPSGEVSFTPVANYNGPASFTYTISDGQGGLASAVANLMVTPVNDAPENVTLNNTSVAENSPQATAVGELSVYDVDVNDTAIFSITGGTGADKFIINGSALEVASNANLDFETQPTYTLEVTATDQAGANIAETFTINIEDIQEGNVIKGTDGRDVLKGTKQDDIFKPGAGGDVVFGRRGSDTIDYSDSDSGILILSFGRFSIGKGGHAENDRLVSIENYIGSDFNDRIIGSRSSNKIDGGPGNDFLVGGRGRDSFVFKEGYGQDTIRDFKPQGSNFETISINYAGIDSFDDLTSLITSSEVFSRSTHIDFGNGDQLTLRGVRPNELSENNFEFF